MHGISHVGNLTSTVVNPLIELVPGAVAGGAITALAGRSAKGPVSQAY